MSNQDIAERLRYAASPAGISQQVALLLEAAGRIESLEGQLELLKQSALKRKEKCDG
jgi:hypothetical protein